MATRRPHAAYLKKPPTPVHEGFAEFITKGTGHEVDAQTVGLVQRLYPVYLKSPAVQKAKAAEQEERERAAREKAEAKAARLRDRLARIEEDRRKVLAELGLDEDLDTGETGDEPDEDVAVEEPAAPAPAAKRSRAKAAAKAVVIEAEDRFTGDDDGDEVADEVTLGDDDGDEQDEQADDDLFEDDDDEEDW